MKAEKTKKLIDTLMAVAFGNKDLESQRVTLNNLCFDADKETEELERLAEIGLATEKAVEKEYYFANPINDGRITKEDIKELLDWAKED